MRELCLCRKHYLRYAPLGHEVKVLGGKLFIENFANVSLVFRRSTSTHVCRYTNLASPPSTPYRARTARRRHHYEVTELIGACGDCGLRRSKSACEMPVEIALITGLLGGSEDWDGLVGFTGDLGIGIGAFGAAAAFFAFGLASFALSLPSSLFARKLAVLAKILRSSTACSTLAAPDPFSITSIRRRSSSRSSMRAPFAKLG